MTALVTALLVAAFFRVQVLGGSHRTLRARDNQLGALPVPAPRGTIYDRNGRILAENVPGYTVTLVPGPRDSTRVTLERVTALTDLSAEGAARLLNEVRRSVVR